MFHITRRRFTDIQAFFLGTSENNKVTALRQIPSIDDNRALNQSFLTTRPSLLQFQTNLKTLEQRQRIIVNSVEKLNNQKKI